MQDKLPCNVLPFIDSYGECYDLLSGTYIGKEAQLLLFSEVVVLYCEGSHGFLLREIHSNSKPYITSDREEAQKKNEPADSSESQIQDNEKKWTIQISASPRHLQLEGLNQKETARFTTTFEDLLDTYKKQNKPCESDESCQISKDDPTNQQLLDELTEKWKKEGSTKQKNTEWLPSVHTIFNLLIVLVIIMVIHSIIIITKTPYSLSKNIPALTKLAQEHDKWAVNQLAANIKDIPTQKSLLKLLFLIEQNFDTKTGKTLILQFEQVQDSQAKKEIVKMLLKHHMDKTIEEYFRYSKPSVKFELIEITGEINNIKATLLLQKLYRNNKEQREIILLALARKNNTSFLLETYRQGTETERQFCINAALSLTKQTFKRTLKSFLAMETKETTIKQINKILSPLK